MSRAFPDARAFLVAATAMTLPALLFPASSLATSSTSLPPPGSSPPAVGQPERREIFVLFPSGEDDLLHGQKRTIFWTSTDMWGTLCAASTTQIAPTSCARFVISSTGLIVPRTFEQCVTVTTFVHFVISSS